MEIKIQHTQLIQLPEMHSFNGKQTHAQKQTKIFKLDNQHSKVYQNTFRSCNRRFTKSKFTPYLSC